MSRTIGSILHGAYGDYYWQLTSLKLFARRNPGVRLRLYSASASRMEAIRQFDLSFADSVEPWQALLDNSPDEFLQYQVHDIELRQDVLSHLPKQVLAKIDQIHNRIFYRDLLGELPLPADLRLRLTADGLREADRVMEACGLDADLFDRRPTLAFLWRYRSAQSAIHPLGQPSPEECIQKYSQAFRRLIDDYDCHVLVTGMKLVTDETNRVRVDAKFSTFGLDLPPERCTYMKGLGWVADLEILSRCTAAAAMASGFSEALDTHRGGGVVLLDPPLVYALKFLKYRVRLFGNMTPSGMWRTWGARPHTVNRIYHWLAEALEAGGARRIQRSPNASKH